VNRRIAPSGSRVTAFLLLVFCALAPSAANAGPNASAPSLDAEIDPILAAAFPADSPGASVIVVKDGAVVYRKAFGRANLELQVPMRPENVFEIGSVTKQFTAVATMMLADEGKLALNDDVRKYIPDFPDKGAVITIEHLLTHTSGVPSYTELPAWLKLWRQDMSPAEILALTKDLPLEFPPGTRFKYDNTGYTMLGMVIEKASGMSYADFITRRIFEPCGMKSSSYGSKQALVANRAFGYTRNGKSWENAPYLSMTQPYAAGSLMSTADDLAAWRTAD
jgi:CubicO group peptidase (beta-lactamase class C family)